MAHQSTNSNRFLELRIVRLFHKLLVKTFCAITIHREITATVKKSIEYHEKVGENQKGIKTSPGREEIRECFPDEGKHGVLKGKKELTRRGGKG